MKVFFYKSVQFLVHVNDMLQKYDELALPGMQFIT